MVEHANIAQLVRRDRPLVVLSLGSQPFANMPVGLQAVSEEARRRGWDLLDLRFTDGALPEERKINGALINGLPDSPLAVQLRDMGCPTVRIGTLTHPRDDLLPAVLPDLPAAGKLAADHFVERRFRHVGYVGHMPWYMGMTMYEAFRDRAEEQGCAVHLLRINPRESKGESGADRYRRRTRLVGEWLASIPKPVGLFSYSDNWGARLCTMCQRSGLAVPGDVAVLGLSNLVLDCEMSPVPLSSLDVGFGERVRVAVGVLADLMRGGPAPQRPVIVGPRSVVVRRSTDVLAVGDPLVTEAMRFMWENLAQDLSVDEVAAAVGCSRPTLERRFREHLHRGINAELGRRRIQELSRLLRETDLPVVDLAPLVGFRTMVHLHRSFRKAHGMAPLEYRSRMGEMHLPAV